MKNQAVADDTIGDSYPRMGYEYGRKAVSGYSAVW
jgi:hypothetical protein